MSALSSRARYQPARERVSAALVQIAPCSARRVSDGIFCRVQNTLSGWLQIAFFVVRGADKFPADSARAGLKGWRRKNCFAPMNLAEICNKQG